MSGFTNFGDCEAGSLDEMRRRFEGRVSYFERKVRWRNGFLRSIEAKGLRGGDSERDAICGLLQKGEAHRFSIDLPYADW